MKRYVASMRVDQRSLVWLLFIFICEIFILTMAGCSDRTPEEYQRRKVAEELAKIQAIAGIYSGEVVNTATGETVAVLTLNLMGSTGVVAASPGNPSTQRAVLTGELTLKKAGKDLRVHFTDGFYNPDLKSVQISIPASQPTAAEAQEFEVDVVGAFQGKDLVGSMGAYGYPDESVSFVLKKDNTDAVDFQDTSPDQSLLEVRYEGTAPGLSWHQGDLDAELLFMKAPITDKEELLEFLLPYSSANLNFSIYPSGFFNRVRANPSEGRSGGAGRLFESSFQNAVWDRREGTLRASANSGTGNNSTAIRLECVVDQIVAADSYPEAWNCRLFTTVGGEITRVKFTRRNL